MSKISNIWGVEGMEKQTTKFYTNKVWFILKEYLKSSELEEVKTLVFPSNETQIIVTCDYFLAVTVVSCDLRF